MSGANAWKKTTPRNGAPPHKFKNPRYLYSSEANEYNGFKHHCTLSHDS
jgi:hypothetical protein